MEGQHCLSGCWQGSGSLQPLLSMQHISRRCWEEKQHRAWRSNAHRSRGQEEGEVKSRVERGEGRKNQGIFIWIKITYRRKKKVNILFLHLHFFIARSRNAVFITVHHEIHKGKRKEIQRQCYVWELPILGGRANNFQAVVHCDLYRKTVFTLWLSASSTAG